MMRLCGSLSESVHINMPLVIFAFIWLFSRVFLKLKIRSHPELNFLCSEFRAGPRNTLNSCPTFAARTGSLTEISGFQTSVITCYYTTRSEGKQESCSRNKTYKFPRHIFYLCISQN